MLIKPQNRRLKYFNLLASITLFIDLILTGMIIGNYMFTHRLENYDKNFMNHQFMFRLIIGIQTIDIVLSLFKIPIIEGNEISDPAEVALMYLKGAFIMDLVSVLPYNNINPRFIFLRLLKVSKFRTYKENFDVFLIDITSNFFNTKQVKILVRFISLILQVSFTAHFFACIWMTIGQSKMINYQTGWV
jgi:hypothetical protein